MINVRAYLFLLICFVGTIQVQADTFVLNEWQPTYRFYEKTEIAAASTIDINTQNIKEQIQNLSFQPLPNHNLDLKIGQYYWGKITLQNKLPNVADYTEWVLSMSYSLSEVEIFIEQADGTYSHQLNGVFRPHTQKEFVPKMEGVFTKLSLLPHQSTTIYFKGKSERVGIRPSFVVTMQHVTTFYENLQKKKYDHAFFIGFIAMMFLYNIILYFFGRDRSFIFYSIYLITLIIYASYNSGDLADWLQPMFFANHPAYAYLSKFAIYIGFMAYIAFMRNFLTLSQLMPKWDTVFNYLFWLGIPWMVVDFIITIKSNFSYVAADKVTFLYILLFFITSLIFIVQLFKTRDKKGYFIVVGIVFWFSGILITLIAWGQDAGFSLFALKAGSVLEIIAFSLGLAYRQRENIKAKEQANFQLEKSKLVQAQEQAEVQRLKELDELKSNLYTNITHEFRTPLTVIMGMNENISGHEQERKLIRRNSKNLLQLINQLLDLSKVESANLELHKIKGDIVNYIQYLTESFQSLATDKGIQLVFYSEVDSQLMDYDEIKIQHIIYNLLSNAIKFTADKGKVILHLQKVNLDNQPYLKIKIKDTGIGIPATLVAHIFDRFYQVDNTLTRKGEGTGIGLALVKELVQLMEGTIEVHSKEEKGTEFTINLPIIDELTTDNLVEPPKILSEKLPMSTAIEPSIAIETTDETPVLKIETESTLPILLIVEDNKDVTSYIQSILQNDYTIHTTENGQLGIDTAIEILPDIIISDVMMPLKNGYEVCEILKADERTSHIPIILLTAKAGQAAKMEGLKYGADAYLTKPFYKEELLLRLEKLVSLRQKLQARFSVATEIIAPTPTEQKALNFIEKLEATITNQLNNAAFNVPQLAEKCQMSQTQLYRKIKAITNKTPSQFIRSIRLQKGKQLLENTDLTIAEIAYEVGFTDPNYFSRTFQQEFDTSPSDYRK